MIDQSAVAPALVPDAAGVWRAPAARALSYPEWRDDACFALEDRSFWFRHRNRCVAAVVRRHPPDGPLFDVGGGNGFVARALRDAGFEAIVVEPGESGVRHAVARGLRPVVAASFEDAGFRPRSLPAVGLFDVLEHVADDGAFLARVAAALRPGGRLYVTVPAYPALWSADDDAAGHHRRYTRATLAGALARAGLAVDFASYLFAWLPLPVFLLRTLPSRLGARRAAAAGAVDPGEHELPATAAGRALQRLFDREAARIARGLPIPFGGSCLVAARAADG